MMNAPEVEQRLTAYHAHLDQMVTARGPNHRENVARAGPSPRAIATSYQALVQASGGRQPTESFRQHAEQMMHRHVGGLRNDQAARYHQLRPNTDHDEAIRQALGVQQQVPQQQVPSTPTLTNASTASSVRAPRTPQVDETNREGAQPNVGVAGVQAFLLRVRRFIDAEQRNPVLASQYLQGLREMLAALPNHDPRRAGLQRIMSEVEELE